MKTRATRRPALRAGFLTDDFLLETRAARRLYHDHAEGLPILDFHNHLSPRDLAEDRRFDNLTQLWLECDHYKWRAMRANGVDERLITGDASDGEKFAAWAATVPATLRNPLYHWTHLELKRAFGLDVRLGPATAHRVWTACNARLATPACSARGFVRRAGARVLCTTDDPTDDLRWHRAVAVDRSAGFQLLPTFRADAAFAVEQTDAWNAWMDRLGAAAGRPVSDWPSLLAALRARVAYFHAAGCRLSDHGLEQAYADPCPPERADRVIRRARSGRGPPERDARAFRSALLHALGLLYAEYDWTQQFHLGALRNVAARLHRRLGRDCGGDVIGDFDQARPLARLLDRWDREGCLARTILYNLNPRDNEVFAALAGAFQDGASPGKIQYGSAWWYLDQLDGIERQLDALSSLGLLSRFVGMVTDSRSLLSFSRHEYFRRVLCNVLGRDVERGRLPRDYDLLGGLVRDVCHDNAARYFRFPDSLARGARR